MLFEMLCHNNSWRMYSNSHIHTQKKKQVNEIATHHNDHRMWNKKIIQSHRTSPPKKKVERLKNVACSCLCAVVKKKSFLSFLLLALLALALLLLFFLPFGLSGSFLGSFFLGGGLLLLLSSLSLRHFFLFSGGLFLGSTGRLCLPFLFALAQANVFFGCCLRR